MLTLTAFGMLGYSNSDTVSNVVFLDGFGKIKGFCFLGYSNSDKVLDALATGTEEALEGATIVDHHFPAYLEALTEVGFCARVFS